MALPASGDRTLVTRALALHEEAVRLHAEAVRLHEEHARHARARGDEQLARKAEKRAARARQRGQARAPDVPSETEQVHSGPPDQAARRLR